MSFKHLSEGNSISNGESKGKREFLFKDLSLKIEAGTSNAFVGSSGFGKTTMLYLIVRYSIIVSSECMIRIQDQSLSTDKT